MLSYCLEPQGCPYDMVGPQSNLAWCQGRATGSYSPLSEATYPLCRKKFWVSVGGNLAKWCTKTAFFCHFNPRRKLLPSVWRFLAPPLPQGRFIPKVSRSVYNTGCSWKFQQSCRLYGIPMVSWNCSKNFYQKKCICNGWWQTNWRCKLQVNF